MWAVEALLALLIVPAGLGVPLYLAILLGLSLRFGPAALAISSAVGLAAWLALTIRLVLMPMRSCLESCGSDSQVDVALAVYIPAAAFLGLVVWWHQRSHSRGQPTPEPAHGMQAGSPE